MLRRAENLRAAVPASTTAECKTETLVFNVGTQGPGKQHEIAVWRRPQGREGKEVHGRRSYLPLHSPQMPGTASELQQWSWWLCRAVVGCASKADHCVCVPGTVCALCKQPLVE